MSTTDHQHPTCPSCGAVVPRAAMTSHILSLSDTTRASLKSCACGAPLPMPPTASRATIAAMIVGIVGVLALFAVALLHGPTPWMYAAIVGGILALDAAMHLVPRAILARIPTADITAQWRQAQGLDVADRGRFTDWIQRYGDGVHGGFGAASRRQAAIAWLERTRTVHSVTAPPGTAATAAC